MDGVTHMVGEVKINDFSLYWVLQNFRPTAMHVNLLIKLYYLIVSKY